jgi:hypothetical protein
MYAIYNCKLQLQPHQGTLCCIVSVGLLLFLNRKIPKNRSQFGFVLCACPSLIRDARGSVLLARLLIGYPIGVCEVYFTKYTMFAGLFGMVNQVPET